MYAYNFLLLIIATLTTIFIFAVISFVNVNLFKQHHDDEDHDYGINIDDLLGEEYDTADIITLAHYTVNHKPNQKQHYKLHDDYLGF